jgi:hypothetical protein
LKHVFPTRCPQSANPTHRRLPRSTNPRRGSIHGATATQ